MKVKPYELKMQLVYDDENKRVIEKQTGTTVLNTILDKELQKSLNRIHIAPEVIKTSVDIFGNPIRSNSGALIDIDEYLLGSSLCSQEERELILENIHAYGERYKTVLFNIKLSLDDESLNIYLDNGEDNEPTHIIYWHIDEFEEDASVAISALKAMELFYTNRIELLNTLSLSETLFNPQIPLF